jgi:hypothetical protein
VTVCGVALRGFPAAGKWSMCPNVLDWSERAELMTGITKSRNAGSANLTQTNDSAAFYEQHDPGIGRGNNQEYSPRCMSIATVTGLQARHLLVHNSVAVKSPPIVVGAGAVAVSL